MFCSKCGTQHNDDACFCVKCGSKLYIPHEAEVHESKSEYSNGFDDYTICDVVLKNNPPNARDVLIGQKIVPVSEMEADRILQRVPSLLVGEITYAEAELLKHTLAQGGLLTEIVATPAIRIAYQQEFQRIYMKYSDLQVSSRDSVVYQRNKAIYHCFALYEEMFQGGELRGIGKMATQYKKIEQMFFEIDIEVEKSRCSMEAELFELNNRYSNYYFTHPERVASIEMALHIQLYIEEKTVHYSTSKMVRNAEEDKYLIIRDTGNEFVIEWTCTECKKKNDIEFGVCQYCGEERHSGATEEYKRRMRDLRNVIEKVEKQSQNWICSNCNCENASSSAYCSRCSKSKREIMKEKDEEERLQLKEQKKLEAKRKKEEMRSMPEGWWNCPMCGKTNRFGYKCVECGNPKPLF